MSQEKKQPLKGEELYKKAKEGIDGVDIRIRYPAGLEFLSDVHRLDYERLFDSKPPEVWTEVELMLAYEATRLLLVYRGELDMAESEGISVMTPQGVIVNPHFKVAEMGLKHFLTLYRLLGLASNSKEGTGKRKHLDGMKQKNLIEDLGNDPIGKLLGMPAEKSNVSR